MPLKAPPELTLVPPAGESEQFTVESNAPLRLADLAIDKRWLDSQGRITLRRWNQKFYEWSFQTGAYSELSKDKINQGLYRLLDQTTYPAVGNDGSSMKSVKPNTKTVNETRNALVDRTLVSGGQPQWLVEHPTTALDILPLQNGLLDVTTRHFMAPTPEFFTTSASPVVYDSEAVAPVRWLAFLKDLWGDDQECIDTLAEWCGYCLTSDTSLQKMLLIVGPKRAGKGTILRVLNDLVGPRNVAAPTLTSLGSQFGLAPLLDKTLATITDARISGRSDQAQVVENLLAISGDDVRSVPRKYLEDVTGKLRLRFVIVTNELPRLHDASGALASRFLILPLSRSFLGREDSNLGDKLSEELPGILNWALAGLVRLRNRGRFFQPSAANDSLQDLEELSSPIAAFVTDCCDVGPEKQMTIPAAYERWKKFAEGRGIPASSRAIFSRNLKSVQPSVITDRRQVDGHRSKVFRGIALKQPDEGQLEGLSW